MDDALLDVRRARALGDDELRKVRATRADGDVLLERDDVDWEGEGERERGCGVVAARGRVERGRIGEAQVELVQADRLDDVQNAAVREDGLDLESLDTFVEPGYLRKNQQRVNVITNF